MFWVVRTPLTESQITLKWVQKTVLFNKAFEIDNECFQY